MLDDCLIYSIDENYHAIIKDTVTEIGPAFFSFTEVTCDVVSVDIPSTVTAIKDEAFRHLCSLKTIFIPEGVIEIGEKAFDNCISLMSIEVDERNPRYCSMGGVLFDKKEHILFGCPRCMQGECIIPDGVTKLEPNTFFDVPGLTRVVIPQSVSEVSWGAFSYCDSLVSIDVDENNPYLCSVDGVLYNKKMDVLLRFPEGKQAGEYRIPDGVTCINEFSFFNARKLAHVEIPDSVSMIGEKAFCYCDKLDLIKIPDSVKSIEYEAFLKVKHIEYHGSAKWYRCNFTAVDWFSDYDSDDKYWGALRMN